MLDRKAYLSLVILIVTLFMGCDERDQKKHSDSANNDIATVAYYPAAIVGLGAFSLVEFIIKDIINHYGPHPPTLTLLETYEPKCSVTDLEFKFVKTTINQVKLGMKRQDIERMLGIDGLRKRIVITSEGPSLQEMKYTYYLGRLSGFEMIFNDFSNELHSEFKLFGDYWAINN